MSIEERIKESVRFALAGRPSDLGSWQALQRRARTERRRRLSFAVAGVAAATIAAVILVPRLTNQSTLRPIEPPGVPTPAPLGAPPREIVAAEVGSFSLQGDERIVVRTTDTGQVVRVLARARRDGATVHHIEHMSLSPDGRTVYFSRYESADGPVRCESAIVSVPFAGGPERIVAQGRQPTISPDGRFLAYVTIGEQPNCHRPALVVRDLDTGEERVWKHAQETPGEHYEQYYGAGKLAWSPDSRHLAFDRNIGDPFEQIWVLDRTRGETILDATQISPDSKSWWSPTYRDEATLAVLEMVPSAETEPSRAFLVDSATGRVREQILGSGPIVHLDWDAAGRNLLYSTTEGLFRWSDGRSVRVAEGHFFSAVW